MRLPSTSFKLGPRAATFDYKLRPCVHCLSLITPYVNGRAHTHRSDVHEIAERSSEEANVTKQVIDDEEVCKLLPNSCVGIGLKALWHCACY
jgi:hypothetical protein